MNAETDYLTSDIVDCYGRTMRCLFDMAPGSQMW
jgi:hypothetical protein